MSRYDTVQKCNQIRFKMNRLTLRLALRSPLKKPELPQRSSRADTVLTIKPIATVSQDGVDDLWSHSALRALHLMHLCLRICFHHAIKVLLRHAGELCDNLVVSACRQ